MSDNDYNNRYDDAEQPDSRVPSSDDKSKFEGFHFVRLSAVVILTFIVMVVALILNSLTTYQKEASDPAGNICQGRAVCGWRSGSTDWVNGGMTKCSTITGGAKSKTISFNYADICNSGVNEKGACMALDAGNVYMIFTIFAIIFNAFTICIIVPLYCRETSIFPIHICNTKTRWFLIGLFTAGIVCNLIAICVWMGGGPEFSGLCDNADPQYTIIFTNNADGSLNEANNWPSYSMGGLMLVLVANIVACSAVTCCWGDNRKYGDEMDEGKRQRQKEREMRGSHQY